MAARSETDATRCDHSKRQSAIDLLLLFLDNSHRPTRRPITTGGSMEAHESCRHRYGRTTCLPALRLDQILVPPVESPPRPGETGSAQWGRGEDLASWSRVTARMVAG